MSNIQLGIEERNVISLKKKNIRPIAVLTVLLLLAHLLVFLLPFHRGGIFWFSYVFLLIAFAVAAGSNVLAFHGQKIINSRFYGIPIAKIGMLYLVTQGVLTLVFMALGQFLWFWLVLLIDALLLGAVVLGMVAQDFARDHILDLEVKLDRDVSAIRTIQSTTNLLPAQCKNEACRTALQKLADEFRYSDPVSGPSLLMIESDLQVMVDDLHKAVSNEENARILDLCDQTRNLLLERNRQCKLNKHAR